MTEPWDDREKRLENMEAEARRVEEAVIPMWSMNLQSLIISNYQLGADIPHSSELSNLMNTGSFFIPHSVHALNNPR